MVDAPALTRLVGEVASFLETSWGAAPHHLRAGASGQGLRELLTIGDVDRLVAGSGLRAPAFRLVERGRTLPMSRVTRRARIGSRPVDDLVDVAAVHRAVGDGATLVLQGLHRSFAPVARFCRDLEATLSHPVQANAYLTPPVAQGLNLHEDPHDVFAIQTYGSKRWVVHPPVGTQPWDLELEPGDVLYLPAGTRHAAQTVATPSLHLTLGVRTITWRQPVERAIAAAVDVHADARAGLERPLPPGWAHQPHALENELAGHLEAVADALRSGAGRDGIVDGEAQRFLRSRWPDLGGGLQDLLELDGLTDRSPLRRREDVVLHVVASDERVEVVLRDRVLRMPGAVAPAVRRIVAGHTLRPGDLDDVLDTASRMVLCRRLVREGVLTVVRDADGARGD